MRHLGPTATHFPQQFWQTLQACTVLHSVRLKRDTRAGRQRGVENQTMEVSFTKMYISLFLDLLWGEHQGLVFLLTAILSDPAS